jgi:hypothetical protein
LLNETAKFCERCGSLLGREAIRLEVAPIGNPASSLIPSQDLCRECSKSLSRWIDRGKQRTAAARKPKAPRAEKKSSRRGKYRPQRQEIALGAVIMLCLGFGYYLYKSFQ